VKLSDIVKSYEEPSISGDFAMWCERLELVVKLQAIEQLETVMPLFLAGPAFNVYQQLDESVKKDYSTLKEALQQAFGMNAFMAYEKLQRQVYVNGESVDAYLSDIKRLVVLMGQKSNDPLRKCAFVVGLPQDIAVRLKTIVAIDRLSVEELASRARLIMASTGSPLCAVGGIKKPKVGACFSCGTYGHVARNCRKANVDKRRCFRCGSAGHLARNCRQHDKVQGNESGEASALSAPPTL